MIWDNGDDPLANQTARGLNYRKQCYHQANPTIAWMVVMLGRSTIYSEEGLEKRYGLGSLAIYCNGMRFVRMLGNMSNTSILHQALLFVSIK